MIYIKEITNKLICIIAVILLTSTVNAAPKKSMKRNTIQLKAIKQIRMQDDGNKKDLVDYKERIKDLISSVEFAFNVLGNDNASQDDKTAIITSSYLKFFKDDKVQVEDDLDESRKITLKKNIRSYLQDIDYFYKTAKFSLDIDDISYFNNPQNAYFKVTVTRNLQGITYNDEPVNNIKKRFFEINLDVKKQDLKIASIYSENDSNKPDDNRIWWRNLPVEWVNLLTVAGNIPANASDTQLVALLNKEELSLTGNKNIKDIMPLYKFSKLKRLDASFTPISNLDALRSLTQLEELNIDSTKVKDINSLKYLTGLKKLSIANTLIKDGDLITPFSGLTDLNISGLKYIYNFTFLKSLKQLTTLQLANTNIKSDTILTGLINLKTLDISYNYIAPMNTIAMLSNLVSLNIDSTHITDLQTLKSLQKLQTLSCNDNIGISNLEALKNLPNISIVYADGTNINTRAAEKFTEQHPKTSLIYESKTLTAWWITLDKGWKDAFRRQSNIKGIADNEQLSKIAAINIIDVSNDSTIYNIKPLAQLRALTKLTFNNTHIADLQAISNNTKLERIDFNNTTVNSLTPLYNLPKLKYIDCNNTEIDSAQVVVFINKHPDCIVLYQSNKLKTWWAGLNNDWKNAFAQNQKWTAGIAPTDVQLHELANAESITIQGFANINTLQPLLMIEGLKSLSINGSQISDIALITRLKNLTHVEITQCPLKNILPLTNLPNLTALNLHATAIEDLETVGKLTKLEVLNCSATPITNLKPINTLKKLKDLNCSVTRVSTLRHLKEITGIISLKCFNTNLSKSDIESFRRVHPTCSIVYY
jgi:Leucine-rich repeat (LRR) protein